MTKVTVHEADAPATPSEELIRKALRPEVITDARGRKMTMRQPGPLAQYRLIEALGPLAANQTYMQTATPLLFLGDIDGEAVLLPKSKLEFEALIQRLDHDGLDAVMTWYMVNIIGPATESLDAAARAAEDKAALKN